LEGSRAFLVEVQALVSPASYGTPQRVSLGFNHRKLALLLAVVEKNLSINLRNNDVFLNLTGGIKVTDPGLDLSIVAAILSSFKEITLPANTLLLGEVGLNGEIRPVSQTDKRIKEAKKLGYENIIISAKSKSSSKESNIKRIKHIRQLFPILFNK
jgi:DNA repair protein RadA/Sms